MSLEHFIKFISEGEPVSPGTANRPLQQLDQNIQYLWNIIQAASLGSTVYARSQTIAETLKIGQPVYFNAVSSRFEAAFASTESDTVTGYLAVPDQAQVWGIVAVKHNATLADILLFGYAHIDMREALDITLAAGAPVPAATWYLSGMSAGMLTRQLPPVTIPVCKTNNNGGVYVNPKFVDFLENHRHYAFSLTMLPAGSVTPPAVGASHVILNPDFNLPGWLPANAAIFENKAPAGAKFGYNLSQDLSLKNLYPPVPLQSACIQMQRPSIWDTSSQHRWYGQQLMEDLVVIDRNGIWWMSDCYDEVPWPTDLNTDSSTSASTSYSECAPLGRDYVLKLYYTRVGFATDISTVTSLKSLDPRILIRCSGQDVTGSTGDLDIDLNLSFMIGNQNLPGYRVFKTFNPTTNTFNSGPVAEGVYAASANVLLSSPHTTTDSLGRTVYHGPIGLGVLSQPTQELASQLVRLDGATEESYPVLYIGMPNDITTSYIVKFDVPSDAPANSNFKLRLRLLGRAAGTLPQLNVSYYVTTRPTAGLATPINVTQSYTALTINTVALVGANQAVEANSSLIQVNAGSIIYVKVERTPASLNDAYAGELGIMQQTGILTAI
jgi:hypothetical protein